MHDGEVTTYMSKKLPAFQFYPKDWLSDFNLSMCSLGAQGLWLRLMCYMHQGEPYGHLRVNGRVIGRDKLPDLVGKSPSEVWPLWDELMEWNVPAQAEDGCYYSRRMVEDEEKRLAFAAHGKRGGNPDIKGKKGKPDGLTPGLSPPDNGSDKAESLSSSAFASSEKTNEEEEEKARLEFIALVNRHFPSWANSGEQYRDLLNHSDHLPWVVMVEALHETMAQGITRLSYCKAICGDWAERGFRTKEDVDAHRRRREAEREGDDSGRATTGGPGGTTGEAEGTGPGRGRKSPRPTKGVGRRTEDDGKLNSLSL